MTIRTFLDKLFPGGIKSAAIAQSAIGSTTVIAGETGKNIYVFSQKIVLAAAGTIAVRTTATMDITEGVLAWSGGYATYTAAAVHNLEPGDYVVVAGATPSGYNGTYEVYDCPTSKSFRVAMSDPGAYSSGTVTAYRLIEGAMSFAANGGFGGETVQPVDYLYEVRGGEGLVIVTTGTGAMASGRISYWKGTR